MVADHDAKVELGIIYIQYCPPWDIDNGFFLNVHSVWTMNTLHVIVEFIDIRWDRY